MLGLCTLALGALGGAIVSCLEPTEVVLHVSTNLPCTDANQWKGVSVFVGAPGSDVETRSPTLTTTTCDANGDVGSLVIVPSGAKDDEIGIRVVAGLTVDPEQCASHGYAGCIVARRTLRYTPHSSLDVRVALTSDCVGLSCDVLHTCSLGQCVDPSTNAPLTAPDGAPLGPSVRCGDNGARCATNGLVCCLSVDADAGTTFGECKNPADCPPQNLVINCDKESDCAGDRDDAGRPRVCCLKYAGCCADNSHTPHVITGSQCLAYDECAGGGFGGDELCSDRQPCIDHTFACSASLTDPPGLLPGYFWCEVP